MQDSTPIMRSPEHKAAMEDAIYLLGDPGDSEGFEKATDAFGRLIGYLFPDEAWDLPENEQVRALLWDLGITAMHTPMPPSLRG